MNCSFACATALVTTEALMAMVASAKINLPDFIFVSFENLKPT
jgi:hypothetical protein